jgi:hypothetical protein
MEFDDGWVDWNGEGGAGWREVDDFKTGGSEVKLQIGAFRYDKRGGIKVLRRVEPGIVKSEAELLEV